MTEKQNGHQPRFIPHALIFCTDSPIIQTQNKTHCDSHYIFGLS